MNHIFITLFLSTSLLTFHPVNAGVYFAPVDPSNVTTSYASKNSEKYKDAYADAFNDMQNGMNKAKRTKSINRNFVLEMIPHHEGAIEMSKAIVKYGSNPSVKTIANSIITAQSAEIPLMEKMAKRFKKEKDSDPKDAEAYLKQYDVIKDAMFRDMQSIPLSDNPDATFLRQMVYHHKGAIDMAKNLLQYTKDPELIKMGRKIISSQTEDIKKMKDILNSLF